MDGYGGLSENERKRIKTDCASAVPLFDYLIAEGLITKEETDTYNVGLLCKKFDGVQRLLELKEMNDEVKIMSYDLKKVKEDLGRSDDPDKREEKEKIIEDLKNKVDAKCQQLDDHIKALQQNETVSDEVKELELRACEDFKKTQEESAPKKFVIVGDGDPIDPDSLFEKDTAKALFMEILKEENKTQLGTFKILPDEAAIELYVKTKSKKIKNLANTSESYITINRILQSGYFSNALLKKNDSEIQKVFTSSYVGEVMSQKLKEKKSGAKKGPLNDGRMFPQKVLFKSISFETREGGMVDIRLQTLSADKEIELYFESEAPVSMLNFTRRAKRSFLVFSNKFNDRAQLQNMDYRFLDQLFIRVSDVIKYVPNPGNNFVPEDVALTLPTDVKAEYTENVLRNYELINNTSLSNLLDLRSYTDFLGLFGDEDNGIFQLEGKADFFLNPFNFSRSSLYISKKLTPYIRYSRFDEDNGFIQVITNDENVSGFNSDRLELIEKSNFEFGLDWNFINFRLFKESPVWISVNAPLHYYTTKIRPIAEGMDMVDPTGDDAMDAASAANMDELAQTTDDNDENFNTLAYGLGATFEVKRLNNFGFNFGSYLKWYTFLGDYTDSPFEEPDSFMTHSIEAEVFYFPNDSKNQSVFLRMRAFRDITDGDAAFNQIQFGYRFTLGVGKRTATTDQ